MKNFYSDQGYLLQDNPIMKKLYLNFSFATKKFSDSLNICAYSHARNRYCFTVIKLFLVITLILMLFLNCVPCEFGLNPSPKKSHYFGPAYFFLNKANNFLLLRNFSMS